MIINTMFVKKDTALPAIQFFQRDIFTHTFVILNLFEVLRVVRIHNTVWVRTSYNLIHGYKYSGGTFRIYLHGPSEDGGCMGPTRKTTVSKFSVILRLFVKRTVGGSVENVG